MLNKLSCCIKYYRKSASACWLLLLYFLLTLYVGFANVRSNQIIGTALADFNNLWGYAPSIVWWELSWGIANGLASIALCWSADFSFTTIHNLMSKQLLDMEYGEYVKYSVSYISDTTNACVEMVDVVNDTVHVVGNLVRFGVMLLGIYTIAPQMIPFYLISYPLGGVIICLAYVWYDKQVGKLRKTQRMRNKELGECIDGFSEVRGFCTQRMHLNSLRDLNAQAFRIRTRSKLGLHTSIMIFSALELVGIIFAIACIADWDQGVAIAKGASLIMMATNMSYALDSILSIVTDIARKTMHVPDFIKLMDSKVEPDGKLNLNTFDSSIEFQNVSFGYDKTSTVLDGIDLTIHKGEKIGICGLSGGGKSTMLKLLPKFYVPTEGKILVDGIDLNEIETSSLRNKMGIVSQDPHLLDATIRENVAYGTNASDYEVIEACKKANIYDFIDQLPERFDTVVGPRGFKLSGGQKQRISLARVFLRNPEIIILDEATSALDNQAESIVQESLELMSDKTIITVAHRLTTIQNTDRIIVINEHRIAEEGTHQDLINKGGIYANLYHIQKRA